MSALPPVLKAPVRTFVGVAWLSAIVNLLHLTGSLFMLEIYDRVLPSRSIPTLIGLAAIVLGLYAFQALFDVIRGRVLSRIGVALDETLGVGVFRSVLMAPLAGKPDGDGQQPLRDLDQVKGFLSGSGPSALFDLPWIPLYLAFCFGFHSLIGLTALGGAVLLVVITLLTELMSRRTTRAVLGAQQQRNVIASAGQRNAEAVHAMGMAARLADRWRRENVVSSATTSAFPTSPAASALSPRSSGC
jgi:ABC-type protease/lipase transport system fused ATPase/permease subunit